MGFFVPCSTTAATSTGNPISAIVNVCKLKFNEKLSTPFLCVYLCVYVASKSD